MFDCEGDSSGLLTLHYGNHNISLIDEIKQWFMCETFADMTIICEKGQTVQAHRLVLAAASPLVKRLLEDGDAPPAGSNVTIQLPDVRESHMKTVLTFLYSGQVNVEVSTFLVHILHVACHTFLSRIRSIGRKTYSAHLKNSFPVPDKTFKK